MVPDLSWMDEGRCREVDPDLFFSEGHERGYWERQVINTCCSRCPVLVECREYALTSHEPQYGVWGGMTEREMALTRLTLGARPGFAARSWIRKGGGPGAEVA